MHQTTPLSPILEWAIFPKKTYYNFAIKYVARFLTLKDGHSSSLLHFSANFKIIE